MHEEKPKFGRFETWGACSRCGARVRYSTLARERLTGLLVCTSTSGRPVRPCLDPWPPVYDFQVYPDQSTDPPPEPLPARWGLDDIWSTTPMKMAPDDTARLLGLLKPPSTPKSSAEFISYQRSLNQNQDRATLLHINIANYDGTFVPSNSVRTVTPPDGIMPWAKAPVDPIPVPPEPVPPDTTPDWVPEGAKIHIDFLGNCAWDGAVVGIETLLGSDPNTVSGWGATEYDSANLTAEGYVGGETAPALIGAARTAVFSGATIVTTISVPATSADLASRIQLLLLGALGNTAVYWDLQPPIGSLITASWVGAQDTQEGIANFSETSISLNRVALTTTPLRFEYAGNGLGPFTFALQAGDYPTVGTDALVAGLIEINENAIQSITIYDPLPTTAGLSELSQTGIPNTAPIFSMIPEDIDVSYPVEQATTGQPMIILNAIDADGNPLTYSIEAGGDAALFVLEPSDNSIRPISDLTVGLYIITARATDPGGLYCEQVFTITVTASTPDWVPANAKIHIDFLGNRAWAGAVVGIETLLGSDPNTENDWGTSEYNPSNITVHGYEQTDGKFPALIGSARTMLLSGATIVVQMKTMTADGGFTTNIVISSADGNDAIRYRTDVDTTLTSYNGDLYSEIDGATNIFEGALNRAAMTLTTTRCDIAVSGSAAVAGSLVDADRPAANPLAAAVIDVGNVGAAYSAIQSITIYDPLPTTAGLSELSALPPPSIPDWVPANATVYIDFENGHYYAGGAETTVEAILYENDDYGGYDPANIVPGTGLTTFTTPSVQGAALATILAGCTIVFDFSVSESGSPKLQADFFDTPDWNTDYFFTWAHNATVGFSRTAVDGSFNTNLPPLPSGANKVAWTVTPTKSQISANGGAIVGSAVSAPAVVWNIFSFGWGGSGGTGAIRSVTVYSPVADADLPTLSG